MRSSVAGHQKLTTINWEQSSKLILLQLCEKLRKNSMSNILWSVGIWSKLERWKILISECLMSWLKIKTLVILTCHLLLLYTTTTNHFSIWSWHAMKSRFYTTASNDQLSGWTKMKLQSTSHSQTCTKKKKDRGHCLVFYCPSYPLQLSESWQNHYIWEVCSANRWDAWKTAMPAATLVNRKGPVLPHDNAWPHVTQPVIQKLNKLGYKVLPHPPYSPDLSPIHYHFFKHLDNFSRENASTTSRKQKMLSKRLSNPETWIFTLQE